MDHFKYCHSCDGEFVPSVETCPDCRIALTDDRSARPLDATMLCETGGPMPASYPRRFIASVLDEVLLLGVGWVLAAMVALGDVAAIVFSAMYFIVPTTIAGVTPGKRLLELEVRDVDTGQPPGWSRSALRWSALGTWIGAFTLSGILSYEVAVGLMMLVTFLLSVSVLVGRQRRGWHDRLANTIVVERTPRSQ